MPKMTLPSGIRLHYQQVGKGPDLVMIHGLTGNLAVWHLKILPLLTESFRVLTYDLRGHGFSDMPPTGYTAGDMASDLEGLLDGLGIESADIVGHSFGADTALYFALKHPARARQIFAIEAALPALIGLRQAEDWVGWSFWADVLEEAGQTVPHDRRCDTEYLLRLSLNMPKKWGPLKGLPRNPASFLRLLDTTTVAKDYERAGELTLDRVPDIKAPVHLVYAAGTAFISTYDYLMEHLTDPRSVLLPPTEWGHFGPLEQPEIIAEKLFEALAPGEAPEGASRLARTEPTTSNIGAP